jgi:hypothetical protein
VISATASRPFAASPTTSIVLKLREQATGAAGAQRLVVDDEDAK